MAFTWDPDKATENVRKHGVDFVEASTIFGDPLEVTIPDPEHSEGKVRFLSLGQSAEARMLVVAYTEREGKIRIIHARTAAPKERRAYESASEPKTDELRPEYDFAGGVRGKHHDAYKAGTNVVLLDADVAKAFPDSASVNTALRLLLDIAEKQLHAKRPA